MINRGQLVMSSLEFFTAGWAYFFKLIYKRLDTFFADGVTTRQNQWCPSPLGSQSLEAHFAFYK
jgi:hypothetical protein